MPHISKTFTPWQSISKASANDIIELHPRFESRALAVRVIPEIISEINSLSLLPQIKAFQEPDRKFYWLPNKANRT